MPEMKSMQDMEDNGTIEPDDFKEDMLSEIERTNEDTIVNYETKMGYR